jgi:hypothetical protein
MDILVKIDLLEFSLGPEKSVDVKLVCYKPIVIFSQCLKIFGNFRMDSNSDSVLQASHSALSCFGSCFRFTLGAPMRSDADHHYMTAATAAQHPTCCRSWLTNWTNMLGVKCGKFDRYKSPICHCGKKAELSLAQGEVHFGIGTFGA